MNDIKELDQTYHFIMEAFVERGQAPHFTEIARAFSVPPEEGKRRLHALMNADMSLATRSKTSFLPVVMDSSLTGSLKINLSY